MDNRTKLLIGISVVTVMGIAVIGFIWFRTRTVDSLPLTQPPVTGQTPSEPAPPTVGEQAVIDELNKAPKDSDADLLSDEDEAKAGTDPNNYDMDGDGISDGAEVQNGTDPKVAQPRRLEVITPEEVVETPTAPTPQVPASDRDRDGLTDEQEATRGTNPDKADTDGDGLNDFEEISTYRSDPTKADTDSDGFNDGQEVKGKYNPLGPGSCLRETCIP